MTDRDKTLAALAAHQLQTVAAANGMAAEALCLIPVREAPMLLTGAVTLQPRVKAERQRLSGRGPDDAEPLPSVDALQKISNQPAPIDEWLSLAKIELGKVAGNGFGMEHAVITLPSLRKRFQATEICGTCTGQRQTACSACRGQQQQPCRDCRGGGQEHCPDCGGDGRDRRDHDRPCPTCDGQQTIRCRNCRGQGAIACARCAGNGATSCPTCKGEGGFTHLLTLDTEVTAQFRLDANAALDTAQRRLVERLTPRTLAAQYATSVEALRPTPDPDQPPPPPNLIALRAQIPFAEADLQLGDRTYKIALVGPRAQPIGVPFFLDRALLKPLALLRGRPPQLNDALAFQALTVALRAALADITDAKALQRHLPVGISPGMLAELLLAARTAILAYSRQTRLLGAFLASLALGVLGALWWLLPGGPFLPAPHFWVVDVMLLILLPALAWQGEGLLAAPLLRRRLPEALRMARLKLPHGKSDIIFPVLLGVILLGIAAVARFGG